LTRNEGNINFVEYSNTYDDIFEDYFDDQLDIERESRKEYIYENMFNYHESFYDPVEKDVECTKLISMSFAYQILVD
jgi:hypothetical protein